MITSMGDVLREAYKRGWLTTRDGNISLTMGGVFYITPSGMVKHHVHPDNIIRIDVDYKTVDFEVLSKDKYGPISIETEMHWLVQRRSDVKAVVHLHPTYTIAAMYAGMDLQELAKQFPELRRYTIVGPTVPFFEPGSENLARHTHKNMLALIDGKRPNVVGLDRHGVVAAGPNPWAAFEHIERLEHICQIALASGRK